MTPYKYLHCFQPILFWVVMNYGLKMALYIDETLPDYHKSWIYLFEVNMKLKTRVCFEFGNFILFRNGGSVRIETLLRNHWVPFAVFFRVHHHFIDNTNVLSNYVTWLWGRIVLQTPMWEKFENWKLFCETKNLGLIAICHFHMHSLQCCAFSKSLHWFQKSKSLLSNSVIMNSSGPAKSVRYNSGSLWPGWFM